MGYIIFCSQSYFWQHIMPNRLLHYIQMWSVAARLKLSRSKFDQHKSYLQFQLKHLEILLLLLIPTLFTLRVLGRGIL